MMDQLWSYVMYLNNHANLHPQKTAQNEKTLQSYSFVL